MLTLLLLGVFIACVVLLGAIGGLWDNLLTWVNLLLAGLITMNFFEPAADWLDATLGSKYYWYTDLLAFWGIFAAAIGLLRAFTDAISSVRVKFRKPVEIAGSYFFALLCGWQMLCITTTGLHLAPLEVNSFSGAFQEKPDSVNFFGFGPDQTFLGFTQKMSKPDTGPLAIDDKHIFDQDGLFRLNYGLKRYRFEQLPGDTGKSPVE